MSGVSRLSSSPAIVMPLDTGSQGSLHTLESSDQDWLLTRFGPSDSNKIFDLNIIQDF